MRKLGIYIRKSRDKENEKSLKEQRLLGEEFAKKNKFAPKYYDEGIISGTLDKEQRPEFNKLLKDIKSKSLDGVYIWNTDRLAREEGAWNEIAKAFKESKVMLYDNGVKTDLTNDNTYLFYHIKAGMDAHFAKVTSSKIRAVLHRNVSEGRTRGGIMAYGFTKDSNNYVIIDKDEAEIVKEIYSLSLNGKGTRSIATILNDRGIKTRYAKMEKGAI